MDSPVFRSRWMALAFVALMAMGAAHLVGDEQNGGLISNTADQIVHQQAGGETKPRPEPATNTLATRMQPSVHRPAASTGKDIRLDRTEPEITAGPEGNNPAPGPALHPDVVTGRPFIMVDGKVKFVD